jgi:hypothetical protein
MLRICKSANKYKKGRESWQSGLHEFLDGRFWGMFWKNVQTDFLDFFKRWSRILGSRFMEFLDSLFWGCFGKMSKPIR